MSLEEKETWVTVHTTTPSLPPSASRRHVTTPRLLIRPIQASDLDSLHRLRSQPEVMYWSAAGRVDANKEETAQKISCFLPPNDTQAFNCAMCWKETGEVIGMGGMHQRNRVGVDDGAEESFGWPEIGYMFVKEYWGMGLASEFLMAFQQMWAELERKPLDLRVRSKSLVERPSDTAAITAKEELIAVAEATNAASMRILHKRGFEKFVEFEQSHQQDPDKILKLHGYRWFPSVKVKTIT